MPKANGTYQEKPWYKRSSCWAWIVTGICVLSVILITAWDNAAEKKAKANRQMPRSYEEIFTPEEQEKIGIGKRIDGPSDWKPDPNAAERFHEFIENGGNADPALDAIQDGDYHDLLDQNGGPEGF
jgi:hypothetical protein